LCANGDGDHRRGDAPGHALADAVAAESRLLAHHWHIDEIRPAWIHANIAPAPTDSDVLMPEHDRDEKGRMKLPAYLLSAHKAD
jgi:hypothetical protein